MARHIQSKSATVNSVAAVATFTGFAPIGAGNFVVAYFQVNNATNTISSVAMGSNNLTVANFLANVGATGYSAFIAYGFNITGAPTTLVVTFTGAPTGADQYIAFDEYSGTGAAIDGINNTVAAATSGSAAVTTKGNGDLIWAACCNPTAVGYPSGFTAENNDATLAQFTADETQANFGTVTPTWTSSTLQLLLCGTVAVVPPAAVNDFGNGFSIVQAAGTLGPYPILGGEYAMACVADFSGGGDVAIQILGPNGTTYVQVKDFTANGEDTIFLPPGLVKVVVTTAKTANVNLIPISARR